MCEASAHDVLSPDTTALTCYKGKTCSYVILSLFASNLLTRPPVDSSTYPVTLSSFASNSLTCQLVNLSTYPVTLSTITLSTSNWFTCQLVNSSTSKPS